MYWYRCLSPATWIAFKTGSSIYNAKVEHNHNGKARSVIDVEYFPIPSSILASELSQLFLHYLYPALQALYLRLLICLSVIEGSNLTGFSEFSNLRGFIRVHWNFLGAVYLSFREFFFPRTWKRVLLDHFQLLIFPFLHLLALIFLKVKLQQSNFFLENWDFFNFEANSVLKLFILCKQTVVAIKIDFIQNAAFRLLFFPCSRQAFFNRKLLPALLPFIRSHIKRNFSHRFQTIPIFEKQSYETLDSLWKLKGEVPKSIELCRLKMKTCFLSNYLWSKGRNRLYKLLISLIVLIWKNGALDIPWLRVFQDYLASVKLVAKIRFIQTNWIVKLPHIYFTALHSRTHLMKILSLSLKLCFFWPNLFQLFPNFLQLKSHIIALFHNFFHSFGRHSLNFC